jgi:DNA recombination protein RmuC
MVLALVFLGLAALLLFALWLAALRRADLLAVECQALEGRLADRERDLGRLGETFEALSARALKSSNEEFLRLAGEHLEGRRLQAAADLDQRRVAIDRLVQPISEALKRTEEHIGRVERGHAGVDARLRDMLQSQQELRSETGRLVQALRKPNVRGRYGEIQLERVVELAGMRRWCDFTPQESLKDSEGRLQRPDMVVRLPNGRVLAIDAKTSVDAYLDALEESDEKKRAALLTRHAQGVLDQVTKLGRKEYWAQFESLEMVVMFMPGDQLIDAALERRPDLVELAAAQNVILASPSTLIGLLRAVHIGWRERELSDNAEELFRLGRELHERAAITLEHASRVGDALDAAKRRYNEFVGSVDNRLVPTLRKFAERGARSSKTLAELHAIDGEPRRMQSLEQGELIYPAPPPESAAEEAGVPGEAGRTRGRRGGSGAGGAPSLPI